MSEPTEEELWGYVAALAEHWRQWEDECKPPEEGLT